MLSKIRFQILTSIFFIFLLHSQLPAAQIITWSEAVQEASQKNPDIQSAQAKLKAAGYGIKAARSGLLPQVSGSMNYTYGSRSTILSETTGTTTTAFASDSSNRNSTYTASLSATQNLFSGLQDVAKMDQSRATEESVKANLKAVKAKTSFDLKSSFANLLYAQDSLNLTREIIRRRQDNLNMIQLRYENGNENKGSLLLSKAYLEQAKYDELLAQNSLRVARQQLAQVLGRDNTDDIRAGGSIPLKTPPSLAKEEVKSLIATTPDYEDAVAQKKGAKASLTSARSPFFPSLSVNGTLGRQGTFFFPENNRWSVGTGVTWPLFNGGRDYYNTKSSSASLSAAMLAQESVHRQVNTQLERGLSAFAESAQKLRVDQSFLEAVGARQEIAKNRYENGLLTFEDWDIIENDFISRQKQVLQSQRDRVVSEASWEQTQGKGVFP